MREIVSNPFPALANIPKPTVFFMVLFEISKEFVAILLEKILIPPPPDPEPSSVLLLIIELPDRVIISIPSPTAPEKLIVLLLIVIFSILGMRKLFRIPIWLALTLIWKPETSVLFARITTLLIFVIVGEVAV